MKIHHLLLLFILSAVLFTFAEDLSTNSPTPPGITPMPLTTAESIPTSPIVTSESPSPQNPSKSSEEMVRIQFPNNPVTEILQFYEALTQKHLIKDANLTGSSLSITTTQSVPKSQAIELIESALLLNGYALVRTDTDAIKVINIASGKNPLKEGIRLYGDLDALPSGDQIVSFFMSLQYIEPNEAMQVFQQSALLHEYGRITQVPSAQALIVTENARVVKQFARLKEKIDVPPAQMVTRFIQLERADAEKVSQTISDVLQKKTSSSRSGGAPQPNNPAPTTNIDSVGTIGGSAQLIPDTRMNRILVIARPSTYEFIQKLANELDQPGKVPEPFRRELAFVSANDILPVLAEILTESTANPNQPNFNMSQNRQNTPTTTTISSNKSGQPDQLSAPQSDTSPRSITVDKIRIIADNQTNSILVFGPPESIKKVSNLIDKLDQRPRQVYLSALIGRLTVDDGQDFAFNILQKFQRSGDFGVASSSQNGAIGTTSAIVPNTLRSAPIFPALSGLTVYGTLTNAIDVFAKALATTDRFEIISRPSIYTANNKKAVISSGEKIAVPTGTISDINSSSSATTTLRTSIGYEDVSLKLEVIPLINSENEVTLQIAQQNDSVVGSTIIDGNSIPTIGSQNINTTVTVPNKSTVVLGGLITDQTSHTTSGMPFLKDIPLFGYLFKSDSKSKAKSELVILIQPVILENNDQVVQFTKEETDKTTLGRKMIAAPVPNQSSKK